MQRLCFVSSRGLQLPALRLTSNSKKKKKNSNDILSKKKNKNVK